MKKDGKQVMEESLLKVKKAMEELCLDGISINGNTYWCELPKYHKGNHHADRDWFNATWYHGGLKNEEGK